MNIMSGYAMHVRALTDEDIRVHNINMTDRDADMCIAIEGEDLGPCLCAVIDMHRDSPDPLVWSLVPSGNNDEWKEITDSTFADNIAHTLTILFPEVFANA